MYDETRLIPFPVELLAELQAYLRPDEAPADFIRRAVHQCMALEDMQRQEQVLELELIGVLRPELWLWARDSQETALFYQRLGFKTVEAISGFNYTLSSRGLTLVISGNYGDQTAESERTNIAFTSSIDYRLLAEPLRRLGIEVEMEPVDLDPGCLNLNDPDGRRISIFSEKPDLIELMTNGYW